MFIFQNMSNSIDFLQQFQVLTGVIINNECEYFTSYCVERFSAFFRL